MKRLVGFIATGGLVAAVVPVGVGSLAGAPAAAAEQAAIQTVMDERATLATGKAKVRAPTLEDLGANIKRNRTIVTRVGSGDVIASRDNPYPRKPFRLRPGTYRFKTTIRYRSVEMSTAQTVTRKQRVRVLEPAAGTCIYMVRKGDVLGEPGDSFMVWHKFHRKVHGVIGAFQSEYSDLRLTFNPEANKASGSIYLYPTGERRAQAYGVKGATNKSYAAKGWYRVSTATWKGPLPGDVTPHC